MAMTYKTILVHVDNGKYCPARLDIAVGLARRFDAHLVGLHALTAVRLPAYAIAEAGATLIEAQKAVANDQANRAERLFAKATGGAGLNSVEWRVSADDAVDAITLHARYADLVVLGQPRERDGAGVEMDFPERVVMAAGRPVLMVPYAGKFDTVGKRALVAWNAGREATRALTDAIPLLREAEQVHVVAFNPEGTAHGAVIGADIGLYLARHKVPVEVAYHRADDIDVGNQLLSRVADLGIDLIVMGAYGHSRMRELVMGGATRTILESMTAPVLLSH
jgi:nucleotide-binding universal stress UspA family protein